MANKIVIETVKEDTVEGTLKVDNTKPIEYQPIPREDITIGLPLKSIGSTERKEATITGVISDVHIGDSDHLPKTFKSCLANMKRALEVINENFDVKNFNIVLNGDIVSGREVYRYQHLRNLIQRGHWQIELAAQLTREVIAELSEVVPLSNIFVIKGNHESLAENYMMYLTNYIDNAWYAGHYKVLNIAHPIGKYNVLFTHGFGGSQYYPVSYQVVRDCWKASNQYKMKGIQVEEVCLGHTHWLQPRLYLEGLTFSVTGGFQRWEKTISQRPAGMLLYLYTGGECSVTGIRADPDIEAEELSAGDLEFSNLEYYSQKLSEALKYLRTKQRPEEIIL